MEAWKFEAARELANILDLLLQGYFEDKQSLLDRIRLSSDALETVGEPDPLAEYISPNELKLFRSGQISE